jgi:hypothetical protein
MWNSYAKYDRLATALKSRGVDPEAMELRQLMHALEKRTTDRRLNVLVWRLIGILEPAPCPMSHCKHYGHSGAPMNCAAGKTPGRCATLRAFKARKALRVTR